MGVVFDKLGFVRKLEGEGDFTGAQAEKLTDAFYDAVVESVATKQDLQEVRHEVALLRSDLKGEMTSLRSELKQDMAGIKSSIAETRVWAVSVGASVIAVLAAIKYFG